MNRLHNAVKFIVKNDFDNALLNIVTIIDKSAKDIYGGNKVGKRFKKLLDDNQDILYLVMSGGKINVPHYADIRYCEDKISLISHKLSDIIYEPLRNCLVHDAELPKSIIIGNKIGFKNGYFQMPKMVVWGLVLMLIALPCNLKYKWDNFILIINRKPINFDDCWGNKKNLMDKLNQAFRAKTIK